MPYKLVYFPFRGRAQPLRYMLADQGLELEEQVVSECDWAAAKPGMPLGQLPVFYDGDFELAHSNTILRYVARKHGLYGKDEKEAALIDMVNDQQEDLRQIYIRLIYKEDTLGTNGLEFMWTVSNGVFQLKEIAKDNFLENLPNRLATIEKLLAKNNGGSGFFVGNQISFADYTMYDLLDVISVLSPTVLDSFPLLQGFHSRIASRENIVKYKTTEAFTKLPINGNGKWLQCHLFKPHV